MTTPTTQLEKNFRVSIPTSDVAAFQKAMAAAEYVAVDTGERVTTEDGPDAEAILLVTVAVAVAAPVSDRLAALLSP